jgi:hypothetical protein
MTLRNPKQLGIQKFQRHATGLADQPLDNPDYYQE